MPIYKGTTELTKIADFLTATEHDITEVYFGDKQVFTVWGKYDGTLPATYSANGSMLADYRVYGSASGVGDKTENIFDDDVTEQGVGFVDNEILTKNGVEAATWAFISGYIPVDAEATYGVFTNLFRASSILKNVIKFYNINGSDATFVSSVDLPHHATLSQREYAPKYIDFITVPSGATHCRVSVDKNSTQNMIVKSATAPAEYAPYGYEVDMSVSDGTTSSTTPIYIGSNPLGEDEYVSFKDQKVYRRTENLYNPMAPDVEKGCYYDAYNHKFTSALHSESGFIPVTEGSYNFSVRRLKLDFRTFINFYDTSKNFVNNLKEVTNANGNYALNVSATGFIRFNTVATYADQYMLTSGSTATYIPYLQPQDPPVPLPALPTCDGTTITDYAGQSGAVPSRFYAKYRKEWF